MCVWMYGTGGLALNTRIHLHTFTYTAQLPPRGLLRGKQLLRGGVLQQPQRHHLAALLPPPRRQLQRRQVLVHRL